MPACERAGKEKRAPRAINATSPTPSLGTMVAEGSRYLPDQWWTAVFPAIAIVLVVLGFNLMGDGIRDMLSSEVS